MNKNFLTVFQWKCLLLVIVLCSAALNIWAAFQWERFVVPGKMGSLPFSVGAPDENYRLPIISLSPDNALAKAGAKPGDTIQFDHFGDTRRGMEAGEVVGLTWFTKAKSQHLAVTVGPGRVAGHPLFEYLGSALFYWGCLCFAVVIGFRLGESRAMRVLSTAFACNALLIFDQIPAGQFQSFLIQTVYPLLAFVGYGSFAYFSLIYPENESLWQSRTVRRAFYAFATLLGLAVIAAIAENHAAFPSAWRAVLSPDKAKTFLAIASIPCSLACLAVSWRRSVGLTKQRVAWVGICVGTIYSTYFAIVANTLAGSPFAPASVFAATLPSELLALAALAYALLRYRLFDFGFVINRALVATVISTFLLFVFAVTEWSVDKLLHFEGREKNVIFDAAVALAIILCFHRIQHWVNHKVEHTFFRGRYEAAEGLRNFLLKSSEITDSAAMLAKYARALAAFSGATHVSIFLHRADGSMTCSYTSMPNVPAELDANDDLLIDLRHARQPVYLSEKRDTELGELALPMMSQGRLRGVVLLGAKPDQQPYRPDETSLAARAAQQLGMDLENLRAMELEQHVRRLSGLESSYLALERETVLLRQLVRVE